MTGILLKQGNIPLSGMAVSTTINKNILLLHMTEFSKTTPKG